jgi:hypothetical protein
MSARDLDDWRDFFLFRLSADLARLILPSAQFKAVRQSLSGLIEEPLRIARRKSPPQDV